MGDRSAASWPTTGSFAIRAESAHDTTAVTAVPRAAFPSSAEALLVDRLRASGGAGSGAIVGHVLFSPVTVGLPKHDAHGLGLAPLAVLPGEQRRGVGPALARAGLAACAALGCGFVVVLGSPTYYPRFGFRRAASFGLANEYGADEEFMVVELVPRALPPGGGLVRYGAEFSGL